MVISSPFGASCDSESSIPTVWKQWENKNTFGINEDATIFYMYDRK
jgi:hypothetical protein